MQRKCWDSTAAALGVSALFGMILPLILRQRGSDPAISSAPFVATLVDVTGLVIYSLVALAILHGTLL